MSPTDTDVSSADFATDTAGAASTNFCTLELPESMTYTLPGGVDRQPPLVGELAVAGAVGAPLGE